MHIPFNTSDDEAFRTFTWSWSAKSLAMRILPPLPIPVHTMKAQRKTGWVHAEPHLCCSSTEQLAGWASLLVWTFWSGGKSVRTMGSRAPDHPVCALVPILYHTELHFLPQGMGMSLFSAMIYCHVPTGLTFNNSTFYPHSVFMCFVWISEQTAIISLYNINWLVFITQI